MDSRFPLLDAQTLAELSGLELHARTIVEGYLTGLHRSPFQGFSVEFAEHREYTPGDDLRYIDWKVYGKSDRYYLKRFEEETNLVCHVLVDVSESMTYSSQPVDAASGRVRHKLDYASRLAAALALLVLRQGDAVAAATFDSEVRSVLKPSSTPLQLKQLCQILEQTPSGPRTALASVFQQLAERMTRPGMVFIFSDFFDDPAALRLALKHFRRHRHDVTLIQVIDPAEEDFPFTEPTRFQGLEELGELPVDPRGMRDAYRAEFSQFCRGLESAAHELRMQYLRVRTDVPPAVLLRRLLQRR